MKKGNRAFDFKALLDLANQGIALCRIVRVMGNEVDFFLRDRILDPG